MSKTGGEKKLDCVVCGASVVDIIVRPVPLTEPLGGRFLETDPIDMVTGGVVPNAGIAMARLGLAVGAFTSVGDDEWGLFLRKRCAEEGIDTSGFLTDPEAGTSATAVLVDPNGEHTFAHYGGAWKRMRRELFLEHLPMFSRSRMMLVGYYSLLPALEDDLAEVFEKVRATGCLTALDSAAEGGALEPLAAMLPHLDVYVPSLTEAKSQTGETDPQRIVDVYRECGCKGLLGVKLGAEGALLSPVAGRYVDIAAVQAPGEVVDTTGAGDSFYAGLLTGLLRGMSPEDAGRLGAAAGACCVTGLGASNGLRDFAATAELAGLSC